MTSQTSDSNKYKTITKASTAYRRGEKEFLAPSEIEVRSDLTDYPTTVNFSRTKISQLETHWEKEATTATDITSTVQRLVAAARATTVEDSLRVLLTTSEVEMDF